MQGFDIVEYASLHSAFQVTRSCTGHNFTRKMIKDKEGRDMIPFSSNVEKASRTWGSFS